MGRFLADANAGPRIDVHAAFRGKQVGKMHGAVGTPRPERVCPFLAAASAAGVKLPPTHVEASARALEQLRQTQSVNSKLPHYIFDAGLLHCSRSIGGVHVSASVLLKKRQRRQRGMLDQCT